MNVTALGVWGEERGERWLSWNQNRNCANVFKVGAELDSSKDTFHFIPSRMGLSEWLREKKPLQPSEIYYFKHFKCCLMKCSTGQTGSYLI